MRSAGRVATTAPPTVRIANAAATARAIAACSTGHAEIGPDVASMPTKQPKRARTAPYRTCRRPSHGDIGNRARATPSAGVR